MPGAGPSGAGSTEADSEGAGRAGTPSIRARVRRSFRARNRPRQAAASAAAPPESPSRTRAAARTARAASATIPAATAASGSASPFPPNTAPPTTASASAATRPASRSAPAASPARSRQTASSSRREWSNNDPGATVSRFPVVGNGYREDQRADVHRAARYLRVQFPPGTRRALALERLDVLGRQGLTDPVVELGATLGPAFAETEALLAHLERYRDEAALVAVELGRLQDSGVRLQRGTREAASIAGRVDRLDRNLARAIRLLGKASVISQLKGPARSMKRTLEGVRRTVRPLKTAANRARDALKGTERRLGDANRTLLRSRARLAGTVAWSAVETTSVAGIQRCEADAASSGARPALSPVEGYSAARNAQFELTGLNDRAHELAGSVRTVNDGVRDAEDAFSALARFESRLAGLEGALNGLLAPLGHVERVLGQRICVRIPLVGNRCTSVDDVLRAIQDGKDLVGLSFLEGRVDALIDPIVGEVLAPLRRALPAVPAFPAIDLALPDPGAPIRHLDGWDAGATSLQAALDTPAIPGCAAARDAMARAPSPAPARPGGA